MNIAQPAQAVRLALEEEALAPDPTTETRRTSWRSWFARKPRDRDRLLPLYEAVVAAGRDPFWYRDGQVPDTVGGRFDMIAAITALVLVRLEAEEGDEAKHMSVMLTELFIADMDESLRQIGIGDYVVGKHVGRMVGALGGRLSAFRQAVMDGEFLGPVRRNIFHEAPPSESAEAAVAERLTLFSDQLAAVPLERIAAGELPKP
jgi:cytochrome b pre-mRNA-processing protein 3